MTRTDPMTIDGRTVTADPSTAEATHPIVEAGQQAGDNVAQLAGRATDIGFQQADRGREQAATGLTHVAESIRRISLDMQTDQPAVADVAATAADQAERIANYLRENDARQMISSVEGVARRQPLLFLGGAFVLGALASRILKAAGGGTSNKASMASGYDYQRTADYFATGPGSRNGGDELTAKGS